MIFGASAWLDPSLLLAVNATDEITFLQDLAVVLGIAAVTTVVFQRLRQPVVLGYLLAGLIIGPYTPPAALVIDIEVVETLAELGVILLLFSLGLEFSLRRLFRVGTSAAIVTAVQVGFMIWMGFLIGELAGWSTIESLFLGALLSISSTTIIVKAFQEQKAKGRFVELVYGILIVEDLVAIFLLAMLTAIGSGAQVSAGDLLNILARLFVFLAALIGFGLLLVPRAVRALVKIGNPESLLVGSIGFCFAIALLANAFGYSVALGAFIAGSLVAESGQAKRIEHLVQPVRDMFAAVFFVAVGMLIDPRLLAENWILILVLTAATVLGKVGSVSLGSFLVGSGTRTSVRTGMSMAQIGEFSIIIAQLGIGLGATRGTIYPVAVAVVALTAFLTPFSIRFSDTAAKWVDAKLPKPIQTFTALYGAWVEEIRKRPTGQTAWTRLRRAAMLMILDAVVVVVVVVTLFSSVDILSGWVETRLGIDARIVPWVVAAATLALIAPFLLGIVRAARTIGGTLAVEALPRVESGLDLAAAPRRALVVALQLATLVALGLPMLAITQPFLPPFRGAAVFVLVMALLGLSFWRSATNLQGHVRAGTQMIVETLAKQSTAQEIAGTDPMEQIHAVLPGFESLVKIELPESSPAVGRTLAELNLRGLTGASVLAIIRDGQRVVLPTAQDRLESGDLLALVGTREAEAAAEHLLLGRRR